MRFQALATDYDGTLATHGAVGEEVVSALKALRRSGRKLIMVTGRRLEELKTVFSHTRQFDRIVAENGALVYDPATGAEIVLADPPPPEFVHALRQRGVGPIELGRVIVATWEPHEAACRAAIRQLGLDLKVILNKGAVMILPAAVSKATGLNRALKDLGISPRRTAGIGDAENDHSLLADTGCGVAVANAVDSLKERADVITAGGHGAGVIELIEQIIVNDLADWAPAPAEKPITSKPQAAESIPSEKSPGPAEAEVRA
jgi:hydroxymethylpyrimidine pyrophosphatase-like HAD family hydrolase